MTKSRLLKTAILAAVIGVVGAASVAPASAHDYDRSNGYSRDRDDNRGYDRGDRNDRYDRDDNRGGRDHDSWRWRHRHHHYNHGGY